MALSFLKPHSKSVKPANRYEWKVCDENTITRIRSKQPVYSPIFRMHGFVWQLEFEVDYNNTSDNSALFLNLMDIPPKVARMTILGNLRCDEMNVEWSKSKTFDQDHPSWGWPKGQCKTSDVMKLSSFTFRVDIDLISVYNKEDVEVTASFVDNTENAALHSHSASAPTSNVSKSIQELNVRVDSLAESMEMMQNTMRMMQTRMDKEEKENDNNVQQQIDEIKESLKRMTVKMSVNSNEENTEEAIFKKWVVDTLKYPEYFDLFIENGVDTLNVAKLLTKNELKAIGINKIGHQLKIMEAIQALKMEPNDDKAVGPAYQQPVEGGTLML